MCAHTHRSTIARGGVGVVLYLAIFPPKKITEVNTKTLTPRACRPNGCTPRLKNAAHVAHYTASLTIDARARTLASMDNDNVVDLWKPAGELVETPERIPQHTRNARTLAAVGVTHESLLENLAQIATDATIRTTVRDGKGQVVSETTKEDPNLRIKATEKLIELISPSPRSVKRGYIEEIEW